MSSEIFYDKAFIRAGEKYIPVVNHGSPVSSLTAEGVRFRKKPGRC